MIELTLTTDIPAKAGKLALLTDLQFRFAVAQAMTDAAKAGDRKIRSDMSRYIDRPTPFTVNSTYISFANPNRMRAEVGFKQFAAKGTPAGKYLSAMARGGDRSHKRSETILRLAGAIDPDQYITPSKENGWAGDPYGNVPRGTYTMMISQLKAFGGSLSYLNASNSKRSQRKRARAGQFFMSRSGRAILYQSPGGGRDNTETAFMVLDQAPNHERRFPIVKLLNEEVAREYPRLIMRRLRRELASAGFR